MVFMKRVLFFIFVVFLSLCWQPSQAGQHPSIQKIIEKSKLCEPNYYFSPIEINSLDKHYSFFAKTLELLPKNNIQNWSGEAKDLNLIPVNQCVLRSNKNFSKPQNEEFLKALNVKTIVNTDNLSNVINQGKTHTIYVFVPISAAGYPKGLSVKSLLLALDYLAEASPNKRVLLSCLYGKYQSGLVSAIYKLLGEYNKDSITTCAALGTKNDLGFVEMNAIGNNGLLTYDMPGSFKKFYLDFGKALCDKKTDKFFEKLL